MSGIPDSWKDAADLIEEDKRLMEELVTDVCFHLISHKEDVPEEENSRQTDDKICLKQKRVSTIKQLVTKFFENKGKACSTSNDKHRESNNIEGNFTEKKDDAETEICKENTTEVVIPTGNEINDINPLIKTSDYDEKEINTFHTVTEEQESLESKKCLESVHERGAEIEIGIEVTNENSEEVGNVNENFMLNLEPSGETEKDLNTLHSVTEEEESLESKKCLESVHERGAEIKIGIEDSNENSEAVGDVNDNFILNLESSGEIEKDINTLHTVTEEEESLESKKCLESVHERGAEIKIGIEDTNKESEAVGGANDDFILKIENFGETEKDINNIGLTPEEEEQIKSLILLAESNYCEEVSIKTEVKDDTTSDCITLTKSEINDSQNTGGCKECFKSVSEMDDAAVPVTCKHDKKETVGPEAKVSKYQPTHVSSPPMCDMRSPFYINQNMVPVKYYQEHLASKRWTPTQVLYELCCQCNWPTPEFRLIEFTHGEGFWYSVKVVNHNFVSYKKARNKSGAKHLASARCLKFLGFKFSYEIYTKSDRLSSSSISPWSEKYSDYNSISLTREEERMFRCSKGSREPKSDIDNFCYYKRKRSSSNESRNSNIRRALSPGMRRHILKRKRSSDEKLVRLKSRRDISPEMSHRRPYLRMDQEADRRARLVHERIAVTHIYDCKTSHSSRSRNSRESSRHNRRHPSYDSDLDTL